MMHRSAADAVSSHDVVTFIDLPDGYIRIVERSKCRRRLSSESREGKRIFLRNTKIGKFSYPAPACGILVSSRKREKI